MKVLAGVGLLSVLLCNGAEARDIEVGSILICDTEQQAERVSTVLRGDEQNMAAAVSAINAEEKGLPVCGLDEAEYVRGADVAMVRAERQTYQIAPILLVGIIRRNAVQQCRRMCTSQHSKSMSASHSDLSRRAAAASRGR
jgi:hypothetical protein